MDSKKSYKKLLLRASISNCTEDVVTLCLTSDCKDCLGSYTNQVLHHRFICKCECHKNDNSHNQTIEGTEIIEKGAQEQIESIAKANEDKKVK
jgi:hypothetical protein